MTHHLIINGELVLYGAVGFSFFDEGFSALDVREALSEFDGDVTIRLNSGGGFAEEGVAIYHALLQHQGEVMITVDSIAASAASVIAMAADLLVVPDEALLMVHQASSFSIGTAETFERDAKGLRKIDKQMAKIYAQKTGLSEDETLELMKAETWLDGKEAVDQGFADEVTEPTDGDEATAFDYRIYDHAPSHLVAMTKGWPDQPLKIAACAAQSKEVVMTKKGEQPQTITATPDAAALAAAAAAAVAAQANQPAAVQPAEAVPADPAKAAGERIQAILDHDEAKGRDALARSLAFETEVTPEAAAEILKSSPKADGAAEVSYEDRKAEAGAVGLGGDGSQPSAKPVINASSYYADRRKAVAGA